MWTMVGFDWPIREELLVRDDLPSGSGDPVCFPHGQEEQNLVTSLIQGKAALPKRAPFPVFQFLYHFTVI